ncbi:MAG TPA: hypothetical protein VGH73_05585 [Thermoanaerobaculia bacterium]|jgi:hypothetical protein
MKIAKAVLYALVVVGALAAFGWFFMSQLGSGRREEIPGVVLAAPPEYAVVERGEMSPAAAAAELEAQILRPDGDKVGVRFERHGAAVYWLADVKGDVLEERSAGASGTRLQTVWHGGLPQRLRWARDHGTFDAPGLPPSERKNLYH